MDPLENTSPVPQPEEPEQTVPQAAEAETPALPEDGTAAEAPAEAPGEAAPAEEAASPEEPPRKPRSPYANSPYEGFYDTHPQKPGAHKRKRPRKAPRFLGTVACVAAGCLITGLVVSASVRKQARAESEYLDSRIASMERELSALRGQSGNTSTPLPAGGVLTPAQVYARNVNSVVGITSDSSTTISGQTLRRTAAGSGFIISGDGYIVTNYHVVESAKKITVHTQNGDAYEASFIGRDNSADMALIKIEGEDLPAVTLGSSSDLAIGDMVVAIGNPLSTLDATQTVGYISGKNREVSTGSNTNVVNMLQTDAAINSGNSGGPLLNMRGEVVGITTAKYSGTSNSGVAIEGLSFAIPIDDLKGSIEDLKNQGYVNSAYLGIRAMDVDAQAVEAYGLPKGAYVQSVEAGFAAEAAGVQPKDIIVALGEESVTGYSSLARALRSFRAGEEITIRVYRSGSYLNLPATLSQRPAEDQAAAAPAESEADDWMQIFGDSFQKSQS